ncbi:MAG: MarR family transcriptional regulator [Solirubrobacteraceae bacterium]|nr:MarR family transcriptional regulator [Patulibacter sp.]
MPDTADRPAGRFTHVIGRDHVASWTSAEIGAWTGMIEAFESQQRRYTADLERTLGLSPSAAGILGQLDGTPEGRARLSALATESRLSLSRVSRIVDTLEARGLVYKRQCPGDARATNAHITEEGRAAAQASQVFLSAWLREQFFGRLTPDETQALATVFSRLSGTSR